MLNWLFSEPKVDVQVDKEFIQNLSTYKEADQSATHLNNSAAQAAPEPIVLSKEEQNEAELTNMKKGLAELSNNQIGKQLMEGSINASLDKTMENHVS